MRPFAASSLVQQLAQHCHCHCVQRKAQHCSTSSGGGGDDGGGGGGDGGYEGLNPAEVEQARLRAQQPALYVSLRANNLLDS